MKKQFEQKSKLELYKNYFEKRKEEERWEKSNSSQENENKENIKEN